MTKIHSNGVAIVGLPGVGKSTVGLQLARRLNYEFSDVDDLIESKVGLSIREYFSIHGEHQFRRIEESLIATLGRVGKRVLATGGGAVVRPANRQVLRDIATVVYLNANSDDLIQRLAGNNNRPLMQGVDLAHRLRSLFEQRDPLYRQAAHIQVQISKNDTVEVVVDSVVQALSRYDALIDQGSRFG